MAEDSERLTRVEESLKGVLTSIKHLSDFVYGADGGKALSAIMQKFADSIDGLRIDVLGVKEEVRGTKEQVTAQNGAINTLKLSAAEAQGYLRAQREFEERMETSRINREKARDRAFRNWMAAGFSGAGILSAVVLKIIDKL